MNKFTAYSSAFVLTVLGVMSVFLTTSVILDLFDIRAKEGNYVLFIVWTNWVCGLLYLSAAYGFVKYKKWTTVLLEIASVILIFAFIALEFHINNGGIYEKKTEGAMIFRTIITIVLTVIAYFSITKSNK